MNRFFTGLLLLMLCCNTCFSQQAAPTLIKRIPPTGIQVPESDRRELEGSLQQLGQVINQLMQQKDPYITGLLPDVLIYYKAVNYALKYQEFFAPREIQTARNELKEGMARALALSQRTAPWATQKGEVVRGYISKIDGSVQPYGLTVPENYTDGGPAFNLSVWFHGRSETLSEVNFIAGGKGFTGSMPAMKNTIMLYPYGRFCNAFKMAGEVDVLEALEEVKKHYKINENGLFDRGFSMGGAAAWHFAVHYPDKWIAANPGAGFAETADFMKVYGNEALHPTWYERKLWHWYDCTDYASNLANLPLYAYNGDKDVQKQAADIMEIAMKNEGLTLNRIWGLNMGHGYTRAAAKTVDSLLAIVAAKGKNPPPAQLHFTTYTLKYNKLYWIIVNALGEHWSKARVDGLVRNNTILLKTTNVKALSLHLPELAGLIKGGKPVTLRIDNTVINLPWLNTTGSLPLHAEKGKWVKGPALVTLAKVHNLQGPVDDAFLSAFIVVRPSGTSRNTVFDQWSKAEMERFIVQWRQQFRGDAIVKNDKDITPADIASSNLIVFGDAESNSLLAQLAAKLPLKWNAEKIQAGRSAYSSKNHGLIMICPNPLNPKKYVVLNSGFTFREDTYRNNSLQIPVLPDWAVVDLDTLPGAIYPGRVEQAGFFDERWQFKERAAE